MNLRRLFWMPVLGALLAAGGRPGEEVRVPYRLIGSNHLLVRAMVNGKGPYQFLVDTGAPTSIVLPATVKELGLEPDKRGGITIARMEINGGMVLENLEARSEDMYQLTGIRTLTGVTERLDGVIGYTGLSRFRLDVDLSRRYMLWTPLDWKPVPPASAEELFSGEAPAPAVDAAMLNESMEKLGKAVTGLTGGPRKATRPRGYVGVEIDAGLAIVGIHEGSPAADAGLRKGDVIKTFKGGKVATPDELFVLVEGVLEGDFVKLTVARDGGMEEIWMTVGKGL